MRRVQRETSSTEFLEWREYLKEEANDFHRIDHYLAQIAAQICKGQVKDPGAVKTDDFLLTFATKRERNKPLTEEEKKLKLAISKGFWSAVKHAAKKPTVKKN